MSDSICVAARVGLVFLFVLFLGLVDRAALAGPRRDEGFRYTTSFSCGEDSSTAPANSTQSTALILLNPSGGSATLMATIALSQPAGSNGGSVSNPRRLLIEAGSAFQIDCVKIESGFDYDAPPEPGDFVQGLLVVVSDVSLQAEAIRSVAAFAGGVSIDVESVAEQRVAYRPVLEVGNGVRIKICHVPPGNPRAAHTISVDTLFTGPHRSHGDSLGECPREP